MASELAGEAAGAQPGRSPGAEQLRRARARLVRTDLDSPCHSPAAEVALVYLKDDEELIFAEVSSSSSSSYRSDEDDVDLAVAAAERGADAVLGAREERLHVERQVLGVLLKPASAKLIEHVLADGVKNETHERQVSLAQLVVAAQRVKDPEELVQVRRWLVLAYLWNNQPLKADETLRELEASLENKDSVADLHGRVQYRMGNYERAAKHYQKALEHVKNSMHELVVAVQCAHAFEALGNLGEWKRMVDLASKLCNTDDVDTRNKGARIEVAAVHRSRARLLETRGDLRGALEALDKAMAVLKEEPPLLLHVEYTRVDHASVLLRLGRWTDARHELWLSMELLKNHTNVESLRHLSKAHLVRAQLLRVYHGEHLDDAESAYNAHLTVFGQRPALASALVAMFWATSQLGNREDAAECLRRAERLVSEGECNVVWRAELLLAQSHAHSLADEPDKAVERLRELRSLFPNQPHHWAVVESFAHEVAVLRLFQRAAEADAAAKAAAECLDSKTGGAVLLLAAIAWLHGANQAVGADAVEKATNEFGEKHFGTGLVHLVFGSSQLRWRCAPWREERTQELDANQNAVQQKQLALAVQHLQKAADIFRYSCSPVRLQLSVSTSPGPEQLRHPSAEAEQSRPDTSTTPAVASELTFLALAQLGQARELNSEKREALEAYKVAAMAMMLQEEHRRFDGPRPRKIVCHHAARLASELGDSDKEAQWHLLQAVGLNEGQQERAEIGVQVARRLEKSNEGEAAALTYLALLLDVHSADVYSRQVKVREADGKALVPMDLVDDINRCDRHGRVLQKVASAFHLYAETRRERDAWASSVAQRLLDQFATRYPAMKMCPAMEPHD